ncbi:MAG TPA: pyridoxal phosphate-dependent aminotransferase [Longimicrobiales bacterium]|nr:pyridoxal phosphate-dependent aminotransferase [Longimicrobiales bacterium]
MAFSPNVEQLQPSATIAVSTLAKRLVAEGRDVIDLSAGEPDFDTPAWISQAAVDGIRAGKTRYTPAPGIPELRKAIARTLSDRAGRELPWEGVVVTCGAKQALFNACFTLFGPGDEVLVATPYWTSHPEIVTLARAEPVPVRGAEEREFRLTPDDLEAAATGRTRGLIYSSPSNPTGAVYTAEELQAVAEWARDRDVWLIADEIYRLICFDGDGEAAGLLELPPSSVGPFVLVDGASKCFAMTGWRVGFAWTEPEVAAKLSALQSHTTSNASTPSQVAALAAYGDPERTGRDVARMREAFRRRRDLVVGLFDELLPGLGYGSPWGAFYLFFRVDAAFGDGRECTATEFCSWLLEEAGVALVPGAAFGDDRWARMSFAAADEVLERGVRRIAEALGRT